MLEVYDRGGQQPPPRRWQCWPWWWCWPYGDGGTWLARSRNPARSRRGGSTSARRRACSKPSTGPACGALVHQPAADERLPYRAWLPATRWSARSAWSRRSAGVRRHPVHDAPGAGLVGSGRAVVQVALAWFNERSTSRRWWRPTAPPSGPSSMPTVRCAMPRWSSPWACCTTFTVAGWTGSVSSWVCRRRHRTRRAPSRPPASFVQTTMGSLLLGMGAWLILDNAWPGGGGLMIVVRSSVAACWRRWCRWWASGVPWWTCACLGPSRSVARTAAAQGRPRWRCRYPGACWASSSWWLPHLALQSAILRGVAFGVAARPGVGGGGSSASGKTTLARLLVTCGQPPAAGAARRCRCEPGTRPSSARHKVICRKVWALEGTLAGNIARFGEVNGRPRSGGGGRKHGWWVCTVHPCRCWGYDSPVGRDGAMLRGSDSAWRWHRAFPWRPGVRRLMSPTAPASTTGDARHAGEPSRYWRRAAPPLSWWRAAPACSRWPIRCWYCAMATSRPSGPRDEVMATLEPGGSASPATGAADADRATATPLRSWLPSKRRSRDIHDKPGFSSAANSATATLGRSGANSWWVGIFPAWWPMCCCCRPRSTCCRSTTGWWSVAASSRCWRCQLITLFLFAVTALAEWSRSRLLVRCRRSARCGAGHPRLQCQLRGQPEPVGCAGAARLQRPDRDPPVPDRQRRVRFFDAPGRRSIRSAVFLHPFLGWCLDRLRADPELPWPGSATGARSRQPRTASRRKAMSTCSCSTSCAMPKWSGPWACCRDTATAGCQQRLTWPGMARPRADAPHRGDQQMGALLPAVLRARRRCGCWWSTASWARARWSRPTCW